MTDKIKESYDVVIVGAGVGGGAMANRLAEAGASILVIERGNYLPRESDNWSVKAVFHDKKYTAKETWRDKAGQAFKPSTYITSAAIRNSSAPPRYGSARRISRRWSTRTAWRRPGRSATPNWRRITTSPSG